MDNVSYFIPDNHLGICEVKFQSLLLVDNVSYMKALETVKELSNFQSLLLVDNVSYLYNFFK